jgi:hypothetical protein
MIDTVGLGGFQANTGNLWLVEPNGGQDQALGMMAGTSPAIAATKEGTSAAVAFQANTGNLWTLDPTGAHDRKLGMMAGTSPAICPIGNNLYAVAFQANTGNLWTMDPAVTQDRKLGMMAGTSPAICPIGNNLYAVAFQANTGNLWTMDPAVTQDRKLGMEAGTSPAITEVIPSPGPDPLPLIAEANHVAGFLPHNNGFHFKNYWPPNKPAPYPAVSIAIDGSIITIDGDANHGVCGGFTFAALDLFLHNPRLTPPPTQQSPAAGHALFNWITGRFVDSFGPPVYQNALKALSWVQALDHDVAISFTGLSLSRRMIYEEWPAIKADIDAGRPSPLFLISAPWCGPLDIPGFSDALGHSHQVLAYAYDLTASGALTLSVYDPNEPDVDGSYIRVDISSPGESLTLSMPGIQAHVDQWNGMRGFFRAAYNQAQPPNPLPQQ